MNYPNQKIQLKDIGFEFPDQWDPYTGERLGPDPHGPLVFHPTSLAKYYYTYRLRKLWVDKVDSNDGLFEGMYDDGVGGGDILYIEGRGHYPELYLFRLPIQDMYLTKDHIEQIPIIGPRLTDQEIEILNNKLKLVKHEYVNYYGTNPPDLVQLKYLYDQAIAQVPEIQLDKDQDMNNISLSKLQEMYNMANRVAVDKLRKLKG